MIPLQQDGESVVLRVRAVPGARRDAVVGALGDALKIAVTAPPEKGKANQRIAEVLAAALGVSRSRVAVIAGHGGRDKRLRIDKTSTDEVSRLLNPLLEE